jgi:hypothetical protein
VLIFRVYLVYLVQSCNLLPLMAAKHSIVMYILAVLIIAAIFLIGLRFASAEDTWLCDDGLWVKHGMPDTAVPVLPCRN